MTKIDKQRREKARKMRYKHPIMKEMNLFTIQENLEKISEDAYELRWSEDNDALVAALDGDEDEAYQFRMEFSDVEAEAGRMLEDLQERWIPEEFDTFFPAANMQGEMWGYDNYQGDYYGLEPWEDEYAREEAEKKISYMTKAQIIDILKGKNEGLLNQVRAIESQYDVVETASNHFTLRWAASKEMDKFDSLIRDLPDRVWIE